MTWDEYKVILRRVDKELDVQASLIEGIEDRLKALEECDSVSTVKEPSRLSDKEEEQQLWLLPSPGEVQF